VTPIPTLRASLAAAEDELLRLEQADDFAHVTGAWAAQQRVIRRCKDDLVRAMVVYIQADCETAAANLRRIEPIARDAMANPIP
jgi:hypothetical protein